MSNSRKSTIKTKAQIDAIAPKQGSELPKNVGKELKDSLDAMNQVAKT